jgi:ribosome biogenesis protein MAK21
MMEESENLNTPMPIQVVSGN